MIKLDDRSKLALLPLYQAAPIDFPLIRAVLEGIQPGTVHVDREHTPRIAFVSNRHGFSHCFGEVGEAQATDLVMESLTQDPMLRSRYLLWYDPPQRCQKQMSDLPDAVARRRIRIRLSFSPERFRSLSTTVGGTPEGVEVVAIDSRVLKETEPFGLNLGGCFWPSDEAFLAQGNGIAVRFEGKIASLCYAACVAGDVAEIDVATLDEFRGKGLARSAATAFLSLCLKHGITPSWDCFDYNEPSLRLARSLGFEEHTRYPFYSINT